MLSLRLLRIAVVGAPAHTQMGAASALTRPTHIWSSNRQFASAAPTATTGKKPLLHMETGDAAEQNMAQHIVAKDKFVFGYEDAANALPADDPARAVYSLVNASQAQINKVAVHEAMAKLQRTAVDTGSAEVQIAALTSRIHYMITHMKTHPKDLHSRRGLELMVQKRRKLLFYLRRTDLKTYVLTLKELNLRPIQTPRTSRNR